MVLFDALIHAMVRVIRILNTVTIIRYYFPTNLTCYNSSQSICSNNTLCYPQYSCGTQCLLDYNSVCVNNRTICTGFYFWSYYYANNVNLCGPQQICYDNTTSVCLNGTTVCPGLNGRLCGATCYNPNSQTCTNGTIRCINSCNGTCYSNSQYCYNNTQVCNNGEAVCNVKSYLFSYFPTNLTCYNSSQLVCSNNRLCYPQYSCGTQCLADTNSVCVNNRTICTGFNFWSYYYTNNVNLCGPQQVCYDNTTSVCLGVNGTVCPVGNQLCAGICYNPQSQYCIGDNNSVYCLSNPSSSSCLYTSTTTLVPTATIDPTTTIATTTPVVVSGSCCAVQNCTRNSDCCQRGSVECQCYRQNQADAYGSCSNLYVTPPCGNSCPVQSRCKEDSDCCRCQCAEVRFTDTDGGLYIKKQCAPR
ncbi:unnamed protein product [Rotaria magnacalcarata]|uniref:Uncharacterized protein n=1 Tax=Rotaria magnacalcarata TaxID=392030 RepID=A0A816UMS2_9BILA|nr:unnamed protein product [Rotaria magnacalcarata]CAF4319937.1 unnamed protein product [Rotaria magnacalcarata]